MSDIVERLLSAARVDPRERVPAGDFVRVLNDAAGEIVMLRVLLGEIAERSEGFARYVPDDDE